MLDPAQLDALRAALLGGPTLRVAVVFGSVARGTARPASDLDIGILPQAPELLLADEAQLAERLRRASGREVDVVRLDAVDDALAWRVARDAVVLTSDPPAAATQWRVRVAIEHADWLEMRGDALERYRAAIARKAAR